MRFYKFTKTVLTILRRELRWAYERRSYDPTILWRTLQRTHEVNSYEYTTYALRILERNLRQTYERRSDELAKGAATDEGTAP